MSWIEIEPYIGALIYTASGGMALVFIYGRGLLQIRESLTKAILMRLTLALLTLPCALFGYWRGLDGWLVIPVVIWLCAAFIETERVILKRKHRASGPVEAEVPALSLFRPFTTTSLAVRRYELKVPCWTEGRLRIAHISDIHAHDTLSVSYYHSVIERVNAWKPDTVFVTGDFVTHIKYAELLPEILKNLDAPQGVFGSLGNHDHWADAGRIIAELGKTQIRLPGSEGVVINAGGRDRLLVTGCDDPWGDEKWENPAREEGVPMAVLSHTADNIYRLSKAGAAAVFAGHYHAGQAVLPWYGSLVIPSIYGRRFDHGHFLIDDTDLFVTAGVGAAFPPFRLYCHPEILIVDLIPGGGSA